MHKSPGSCIYFSVAKEFSANIAHTIHFIDISHFIRSTTEHV